MIQPYSPIKTNNYNKSQSAWSSMRQPYIFKFIRIDATYDGLVTNAGNIAIFNISYLGGTAVYNPQIGDSLTLIWTTSNPLKKATGKITDILPGGILQTDINQFQSGIYGTGNILWGAFENYKIEVELTGEIPSTGETKLLGIAKSTPNTSGICKIDVQQLLTYGCEKINKCNYDTTATQIDVPDYSGYIRFNVRYADSFILNNIQQYTATFFDDDLGSFFAIDGVKQLLSVYGQNYCDYTAKAFSYPSKFLTAFKRPVLFYGEPYPYNTISPVTYPFSLQTILEDSWDNYWLFTDEVLNDGSSGTTDAQQIADSKDAVTHIQIDHRRIYSNDTVILKTWIQYQLAASTIATPNEYFIDIFPEQKTYPSTIIDKACTEIKEIIIDRKCRQYPIYLMWKNSLGGWDFWLFDKVNETNITANQGEKYDLYVEDIEKAQFKNRILQANGVKTITVGDIIDVEHMDGLSEIERSPAVFMLYDRRKLMSANPELAWIGVQISPKGIKYKSNSDKASIELTIVLPEYYTVPN